MDVEKFIATIKKYPILYDPNHKDHRNVQKRYRVWDIVGEEMNESSEVLRGKWKGLKDGFRRCKKNGLTNWLWAEELQFLDEFTSERGSKHKNMAPDDSSLDYQMPVSPTPITLQVQTDQTIYQPRTSKRTATESSDNFQDVMIECSQSKRLKSDNAIDYLFKSYAETFKSFPIRKQIELKIKLAKLFHNAELEELKDDTWIQAVIKQSPRSPDSD